MTGVLVTLGYYSFSKPLVEFLNPPAPIGFVVTANGIHKIQNLNSDLWTAVSEGDPIYIGDSIRTGELGELRLAFVGSRGVLELEPETEIKLSQSEKVNQLQLVEGFLMANDFSEGELALLNGAGSIPWFGQRQTASRSSATSALEINQKTNLNIQNQFGIGWTGLATNFETEINPEEITGTEFKWTGGQNDFDLWLEWGPSRKKLTDQIVTQSLKGQAKVTFPIGRHFWRWSLRSKTDAKILVSSPTAIALISAKYPPVAVSPVAGQVLRDLGDKKPLELKWQLSKRFSSYKLELSKKQDMSPLLLEKEFPADVDGFSQRFDLGAYFWRISGYDEQNKEWIRSRVHNFRFAVEEVNRVAVKFLTKDDEPYRYSTPEPSLYLKWTADQLQAVKNWKLRWAPVGEDLRSAKPVIFGKTEAQIDLPRPGIYRAQVEALSATEDSIGQSGILNIEALPFPKLRAPSMAQIPAQLSANNRGALSISWSAVEGAKSYQLELRGQDQPTQFFQSKTAQFAFQKLMPGTYDLRILAIDESGRPGDLSERRQIVVPAVSAIKPIKIRKVEVQ